MPLSMWHELSPWLLLRAGVGGVDTRVTDEETGSER